MPIFDPNQSCLNFVGTIGMDDFLNFHFHNFYDATLFLLKEISAARKVDTKVANLLLKVAQKVAPLKNRFKTGFQ